MTRNKKITYYSQHGEDVILSHLLSGIKDGFFIEIGCLDGIRFSNTLHFEELGWKGLCIEAHNDYVKLLRENRPNSIIEHCAAGEKDEKATFFANMRGSLSTLDGTKGEEFAKNYGEYFKGFEEQEVDKRRIDTLLKKHKIQEIDLLSLDIEGYEIEALKGLDLSIYEPKVMVIESDTVDHEKRIDEMVNNRYTKVLKHGGNLFYVRKDIDSKSILNIKERTSLFHKGNPFDNEEDRTLDVFVTTNLIKNFLNYIFYKFKGVKCFRSFKYRV